MNMRRFVFVFTGMTLVFLSEIYQQCSDIIVHSGGRAQGLVKKR